MSLVDTIKKNVRKCRLVQHIHRAKGVKRKSTASASPNLCCIVHQTSTSVVSRLDLACGRLEARSGQCNAMLHGQNHVNQE